MESKGDCQTLAHRQLEALMRGERPPTCGYLPTCSGADVCRRFKIRTLHTLPLVKPNEPPLWEPEQPNV